MYDLIVIFGFQFIKNKFTGEMATYAFIQFESDAAALMAMHKLNGKIIPSSQPVTSSLNFFRYLPSEIKLFYDPIVFLEQLLAKNKEAKQFNARRR